MMTRSPRNLAALVLAVFTLCVTAPAQSVPAEPDASAAALAPTEANGRTVVNPQETSDAAMRTIEKRLDKLITHQEGTNKILRAMAEGMAAKASAAPPAAPASEQSATPP